jgi:glycosyltransferase involved in cell wall biosynthesis
MRVLHLYAGNLYGGIETLLVTLARCRGLCPEMEPAFGLCFEGRLRRELRDADVPVHDLGPCRLSQPWTVWQARRRLRRLLATDRPDVAVCHSCWPHALFGPVLRSCGVPLVYWAHDIHLGRHWLERLAGRTRPDAIVANSRATQAAVTSVFPEPAAHVLHCPVPAPPDVSDRGDVRQVVRRDLGNAAGEVVILQFCRLERWKGHALLLEALGCLADLPAWACWVAGGSQRPHESLYLDELRQTAKSLGIAQRVRFLGLRDDIPRLLAAADIHCQPNTGPEPFGIAFVEAIYAGLPVVTTALGGALEIVDPSCGVLVPPGDAAALADALRMLIDDPERRRVLGTAGPARAAALCDPSRQFQRLYEMLCLSPGRTFAS